MDDKQCLSMLELADLRNGDGDPSGRRHLACCPRCTALVAGIPEVRIPDLPPRRVAFRARPVMPRPRRFRRGQLWRALPIGCEDWAEIVAIIDRPSHGVAGHLVVPIAEPPHLATDRDIVLGGERLGYPAFLDLANSGTVVSDQLVEYLGSLARGQADALLSLHLAGTGIRDRPAGVQTGAAVLSAEDPRLLAARSRGERLRPLWSVVDRGASRVAPKQSEAPFARSAGAGTTASAGGPAGAAPSSWPDERPPRRHGLHGAASAPAHGWSERNDQSWSS